MAGSGAAHRPGAFKQSNKGHNTGRHRSKGAVEKENRGRVGIKALAGKKGIHKVLAKIDRRNKAVQLRKQAREEVQARKRQVGGVGHPPIVVAVVPLLDQLVGSVKDLVTKLTTCLEDVETVNRDGNIITFTVPRFKQRITVVVPDFNSIQSVLDVCKVCDSVVFLMSATSDTEEWGDTLLSAVLAQGLSSDPIFVLDNMAEIPQPKQQQVKKLVAKNLEKRLVVEKVWSAQNESEALNLLRHIGNQRRREAKHRDRRGYLLCEKVEWREGDLLALTGYIRGAAISADRLVHIPGLGDFQVDRIMTAQEPLQISGGRKDEEMFEAREVEVSTADRQELDAENVPDAMEGEQTWPTMEEMREAEAAGRSAATSRIKKVPKGFSEYQAAWIVDEEGEDVDDDSEGDSDEDMEDGGEDEVPAEEESEEEEDGNDGDNNFDTESVAMTEDYTDYDTKHVNFAAEVDEMEALRTARMEEQFPDEVDTPMDSPARVRFQKYRGLKSFRTSVWDAKENLPLDYARIWQFENFDRTRKRVLAEAEALVSGAEAGWYVTVVVCVPRHLAPSLGPVAVVTSLLPHEHRMSAVHLAVRRHAQAGSLPVKSKSRLIFQVGWRRFAACPVFSQHTNGNKHKYERYFRDGTVVMSTFAPITYPPASVLVFQEHSGGELSLLATGSLLNNDPNRIIVKRTVLSGHPFKVHKRVCTIRFMFFNREDIEWFKPVELRTKNGRRGHIKEPLGTHGHMKCIFDGQVSQQDTVLMNLYKRVFPKWTYDPHAALEHHYADAEEEVTQEDMS